MKHIFILFTLSVFALFSFGQDKQEVIDRGIVSKKINEIIIADGEKTPHIDKEEYFNAAGDLIEVKEFKDKGVTLVSWYKYIYDSNGMIIEELELNAKGEQKERIEHKYQNGLRSEKLYYDSKNRLAKKKTFVYEFRK